MNSVRRDRIGMLGRALAATMVLLTTAAPASIAQDRVMVGEPITIGPNERVDNVTCILCSVQNEGEISGDAVVVLGNFESSGPLRGDAVVMVGAAQFNDDVNGSVVGIFSDMTISGRVGQDAVGVVSAMRLATSKSAIGGDVVSVASHTSGISPDRVGGDIQSFGGATLGRWLVSGLAVALVVLAIGLLMLSLAVDSVGHFLMGPNRLEVMADTYAGNVLVCFLAGIGFCVTLLIVGIAVAMLLPVSIPLLVILVSVTVLGYCGLAFGVGRNLFPKLKPLTASLLATTLLVVVQMIPFVGWFIFAIVSNVAIGTAVLSGFGSSTTWFFDRAGGVST